MLPRAGARDGALLVWDARAQQLACQRSGTAYQAPVLAVQVRLAWRYYGLQRCCFPQPQP